MCGIVGKVAKGNISEQELRNMADAVSHRGPDDEGFLIRDDVGLGHRRLSIIDLDTGRQPLANEDESIWVVCNGEIYNYLELKEELLAEGYRFRTKTDVEVIVHLYHKYGDACVDKLDGMFAFAVWDVKKERLLLARDRIGQKPLFYMQQGDSFFFASEVKSILAADNVSREIDFTAVHHYLSLRFIPSPLTMIKGIQKLPPAHTLALQDGKVSIARYWRLDFTQKLEKSEDEFLAGLEEKLGGAVKSHLASDVPVGAFLSGGMDTSTVVALMAENYKERFKTFAIGVKEQDFNELPFAKIVAEHFGTEHIEKIVSADLIDLLPSMVYHLDEPSDTIAACMFEAARLASDHVKVVMGGDGGDELFAGFDRYVGMEYINRYNLVPRFIRHGVLRPIIKRLPDSFGYKNLVQKLRWADRLSDFSAGERYAEATTFFRFSHEQKSRLFSEKLWNGLRDIDSNKVIIQHYDAPNAKEPLDRMLYADFMTRLTEHTLMLTDRMNMAFGLEARSPFLDHTLVEYLARFPRRMKIRGRSLKYILRKFAEKRLPKEIISREKQGFMFPVAYWFRNELHEFLRRQLEHSIFVKEGYFKLDEIYRLLDDHRANRDDNHVRLWMLLNLDVWHQLYIQQKSVSQIQEDFRNSMSIQ